MYYQSIFICKLLIQILHVQNHFTKMLKKLVDNVFSAGLLLEGVFKEVTPPAQQQQQRAQPCLPLRLTLSSGHLFIPKFTASWFFTFLPSSAAFIPPGTHLFIDGHAGNISHRNRSSYLSLSDENNPGSLGHSTILFPVGFLYLTMYHFKLK